MACVSSGVWGVGIMSNANSNRYSYLNNNKFSNNPSLVLSSSKGKRRIVASGEKESSSMATEIAGVKVINNPPQSKLTDLGVTSWPKVGLHEDVPIHGLLCVVEHYTLHSKHKIHLKQSPMSTLYPLYGLLDPSDVSVPRQLERSFLTAIIQSQSPNK
ncbi:hypothetical protein RDI58_019861 [Solanum bulbocastanum]|uniref:Uncharacterized protein n=1 Tax=Solanum bulbocastanum TaxID=147425 RepID=A0AAN8Y6Z0_SOLBU